MHRDFDLLRSTLVVNSKEILYIQIVPCTGMVVVFFFFSIEFHSFRSIIVFVVYERQRAAAAAVWCIFILASVFLLSRMRGNHISSDSWEYVAKNSNNHLKFTGRMDWRGFEMHFRLYVGTEINWSYIWLLRRMNELR